MASKTTPEWNDGSTDNEMDGKSEGMTYNKGDLPTEHHHAVASSDVNDEAYNMKHSHRGHCVIFNHKTFDDPALKERNGTDQDREDTSQLFERLGFQVKIMDDLTVKDIKEVLRRYAAMDHSDKDCFVIVFMSHGDGVNLYGKDGLFNNEDLSKGFTADKCLSLAGKPKLFFIQACRGRLLDPGTELNPKTDTDSGNMCMCMYKIPNQADFLMCCSTVPGHASWRDPEEGSWFMQSLCKVFTDCSSKNDVLTMMTKVNCHMIQHYESYSSSSPEMHGMKQSASIYSTLMRKIYLSPKE